MTGTVQIDRRLEPAYWIAFAALLSSIVFSWRGVTSISIGLLFIIAFTDWILRGQPRSGSKALKVFFGACLIYCAVFLLLEWTKPGSSPAVARGSIRLAS